jgi:acetyltransferase-like isoleucine patch superfamily enzyme
MKILRHLNNAEVRSIGVRGALKSIYISHKLTEEYQNFLLHKNVITEVSKNASAEMKGYLSFGVTNRAPTHPKLGKSKLSIESGGRLEVTSNSKASIGPCSILHIEGDFSIGNSYINSHCRIICADRIEIGDNCAISWNVEILDTDRHSTKETKVSCPILIEDNVWIGHDVTIKKGVTIGEGAVIASNSVVTKDVPKKTLVAGVPAEEIRRNISWN